jgi:hypothetical protein
MVIYLWVGFYVLVGYVAFVLIAELLIWRLQPDMDGGVTITVTDADANPVERNLAGFEYDSRLYVASNHWLQHWYNLAIENPQVEVTRNGVRGSFNVTVVAGDEQTSLSRAYEMGFILRFICGFAPSKFLRLDPRPGRPSIEPETPLD